MKTFIQKRGLGFFVIAAILLWLKTYTAYLIEFKLGISNVLQHILLFVNPISSSLFFLGFALLFKKKWQPGRYHCDSLFHVFFTLRKHRVLSILQ